MCGIFGQLGDVPSPETLATVLYLLKHRGPDEQGTQYCQGATLAQSRLRVLDLSKAGAQPMSNEDQSVWLTFNGEIYNFRELRATLLRKGHQFRSHTDTEVIIHGYETWGDAVVDHLDGMFAFGLWDEKKQRLLLARDRTGQKPLFYANYQNTFFFGSEIKTLLAAGVPDEIDPCGLGDFLTYGYVPAPRTNYRWIQQLPPAHLFVKESDQNEKQTQYWQVDFHTQEPPDSETEAKINIRRLLQNAVQKRLIADVPVGAFLSGGLDSSIIVGLMAQYQRPKTFSIGFSGDKRYDETSYARIVSNHFDTDHHEFFLGPETFSLIEKLVWHHDGPFGDSSAIPTYLVSQYTKEHVTVALSGDGGDELFAGYLRFWAARLAENIPKPLRQVGTTFAQNLPSSMSERSFLGRVRRFLLSANKSTGDRLAAWAPGFAFQLETLLLPDVWNTIKDQNVGVFHRKFFGDDYTDLSSLSKILSHNFHTYLPYDLLVKTDRSSMAHGLEVRAPFLDTELISYVMRLPDHYKIKGRRLKYILHESFSSWLPEEILQRSKMGFGVPLAAWFRTDLKTYLQEYLLPKNAQIKQYLHAEKITTLVNKHLEGSADYSHQLWMLLTLEIWLQTKHAISKSL